MEGYENRPIGTLGVGDVGETILKAAGIELLIIDLKLAHTTLIRNGQTTHVEVVHRGDLIHGWVAQGLSRSGPYRHEA